MATDTYSRVTGKQGHCPVYQDLLQMLIRIESSKSIIKKEGNNRKLSPTAIKNKKNRISETSTYFTGLYQTVIKKLYQTVIKNFIKQ